MKIVLEVLPEHERSDVAVCCWLCAQRFVVGAVAAWGYADTAELDLGPVCPACLAEGPATMEERLKKEARSARQIAEESELLASEGISAAPTAEEFREAERLAASG
jgi:hypothetical protein